MITRRLFCPWLQEGLIELSETQAHHAIRVLRLKQGDFIELFDGQGHQGRAEIVDVDRSNNAIHLQCEAPTLQAQPKIKLHLGVAFPKGDRSDWLVEKVTELGVSELTFLDWKRSQEPPKKKQLQRHQRIITEAARQCGRARLPILHPFSGLADFLNRPQSIIRLVGMPSLASSPMVHKLGAHRERTLLIGPEGGITDEELALLEKAGYIPFSMNPWTLRIETAAVAGATLLMAPGETISP